MGRKKKFIVVKEENIDWNNYIVEKEEYDNYKGIIQNEGAIFEKIAIKILKEHFKVVFTLQEIYDQFGIDFFMTDKKLMEINKERKTIEKSYVLPYLINKFEYKRDKNVRINQDYYSDGYSIESSEGNIKYNYCGYIFIIPRELYGQIWQKRKPKSVEVVDCLYAWEKGNIGHILSIDFLPLEELEHYLEKDKLLYEAREKRYGQIIFSKLREKILEEYKDIDSIKEDLSILQEAVQKKAGGLDLFGIPLSNTFFQKPFYFIEIKKTSKEQSPPFSKKQRKFVHEFKDRLGILIINLVVSEENYKEIRVRYLKPN